MGLNYFYNILETPFESALQKNYKTILIFTLFELIGKGMIVPS